MAPTRQRASGLLHGVPGRRLSRHIARLRAPRRRSVMIIARVLLMLAWALATILSTVIAFASGGIFTTNSTGTVVDQNLYATSTAVYLSGGPQNTAAAGL